MVVRRRLQIESLEARLPMKAEGLLSLDVQAALALNSRLDSGIIGQSAPRSRQISYIQTDQIHSIDLSAQGAELRRQQVAAQMPAGANSLVLQAALDANSAVGLANYAGATEAILWVRPDLPVRLDARLPLAGYEHANGTIDVVVETDNSLHVKRFDSEGMPLSSQSLPSDVYFDAHLGTDGVLLLGELADVPQAAWIDSNFQKSEFALVQPASAVQVVASGSALIDNQRMIVGTWLDGQGQTHLVGWNLAGQIVYAPSLAGTSAIESDGRAMLVDTPGGQAILVFDAQLAQSLGTSVGTPFDLNDLLPESRFGWRDVVVNDLQELNGELYLSVSGVKANNEVEHAVWAYTANWFPSPWQNRRLLEDVDRGGQVTPLDALLIINRLNSRGAGTLAANDLVDENRYDVNGDGVVTPIDVLLVINRINAGNGQGESESAPAPACPAIGNAFASFNEIFIEGTPAQKKQHG